MSIDIFKIFYFFVFVSLSLSTYTFIIADLKTLSILFEKIFFFLCLFLSFVRVRMYVCRYVHKINYPTEHPNFSIYPTEQLAHARKNNYPTERHKTQPNPTERPKKFHHPTERRPKVSKNIAPDGKTAQKFVAACRRFSPRSVGNDGNIKAVSPHSVGQTSLAHSLPLLLNLESLAHFRRQ
jgi:hypothetical protein